MRTTTDPSRRRRVENALRRLLALLSVDSLDALRGVSDAEIARRVQVAVDTGAMPAPYIARFLRMACRRLDRPLPLPLGALDARSPVASPTELARMEEIFGGQRLGTLSRYHRWLLLLALRTLHSQDPQSCDPAFVRACLAAHPSPTRAIAGLRLALSLLGTRDGELLLVQQQGGGGDAAPHLTRIETQWLAQHSHWWDPYIRFKRAFTHWCEEQRPDRHASTRSQRIGQVCAIVRSLSSSPEMLMDVGPRDYTEVVGAAAHSVQTGLLQGHRSLLAQGRRTRSKNQQAHAFGRSLSRLYAAAGRELLAFWSQPSASLCTAAAVYAQVQQGLLLPPNHPHHHHHQLLSNAPPPAPEEEVDALSEQEMQAAVGACADVHERLIILLLARLGMRQGAIRRLHLRGVLADSDWEERRDQTRSSQSPWLVRRMIRGFDKGGRINQWDLGLDPAVQRTMQEYLNLWWRPRYEGWDEQGELRQHWLFPAMRMRGNRISSAPGGAKRIARVVRRVLARIGVSRFRAHAHAFRKGLVTLLFRCGNSVRSIAAFVHHQNTKTTEESYDMPRSTLLRGGRMVGCVRPRTRRL